MTDLLAALDAAANSGIVQNSFDARIDRRRLDILVFIIRQREVHTVADLSGMWLEHLQHEVCVTSASVADADLIICLDSIDQHSDPESFVVSLAQQAKIGCVLLEESAPFEQERCWHPGNCLERNGWDCLVSEQDRLRTWEKISSGPPAYTSLYLMAYRGVSLKTFQCVVRLLEIYGRDKWRIQTGAEAGIARARNIVASRWWLETDSDVLVMVDDDVLFSVQDLDRLADRCRNGYPLICGGYPVRDGHHMALRGYDQQQIRFIPDAQPVEIQYAATGFMAIHRSVLDALVSTLPYCHARETWAFWPFFDFESVPDETGWKWLSEDWLFSRRAKDVGFPPHVDPSIHLRHIGEVAVDVDNMQRVYDLLNPPMRST